MCGSGRCIYGYHNINALPPLSQVDADDITVTAEYSKLTPKVNDDMAPPVITGIGGYFTKLMVSCSWRMDRHNNWYFE